MDPDVHQDVLVRPACWLDGLQTSWGARQMVLRSRAPAKSDDALFLLAGNAPGANATMTVAQSAKRSEESAEGPSPGRS